MLLVYMVRFGYSWVRVGRPLLISPTQTTSPNPRCKPPYIRGHSLESPLRRSAMMFTQMCGSKDRLFSDLPAPQLSPGAFILAWPGCHGCHSDHMLISQTRMWASLWNVWSFSGDSGHVYLLSLNLNTTGVHFAQKHAACGEFDVIVCYVLFKLVVWPSVTRLTACSL